MVQPVLNQRPPLEVQQGVAPLAERDHFALRFQIVCKVQTQKVSRCDTQKPWPLGHSWHS
jgi:hypothetical protein